MQLNHFCKKNDFAVSWGSDKIFFSPKKYFFLDLWGTIDENFS